jgi:cytochrome c oxidase cbb3-type subunit 3
MTSACFHLRYIVRVMHIAWTVLFGFLVASAGDAENPLQNDPNAADVGRGVFRIYCSPCHGIRGQGARGPDLTQAISGAGKSDDDLFRIVSEGSPGTEMPGFAGALDDDNRWRAISYIRSIAKRRPAPLAGNPAAGRDLYWGKAGCAACHRIDLKGGRLGPDLSRIGSARSASYLRESVLTPSADITPGYNTIVVVQKDGKKITGVERGYDNFTAQLMDGKEEFHSFDKAEVASVKLESRSLMPDTYGKLLSASELDDLLAYLSSLGRPEAGK